MNELTIDEINEVNGGTPVYAAAMAVGGYLAVLDAAWNFGHGLGQGLYAAIHR